VEKERKRIERKRWEREKERERAPYLSRTGTWVTFNGTARLEEVVVEQDHPSDGNGFGGYRCLHWNGKLELVSIGQQLGDAFSEISGAEFSYFTHHGRFAFLVEHVRVLDIELNIAAEFPDEMRPGDPVQWDGRVAACFLIWWPSVLRHDLW
jgi:hypothetical protein